MDDRRTIEVKALTRVEGEGRLYAKIRDGAVEQVELNIYEPPRYFESLLRGRPLEEAPDITARICGICPVAYQMSACHALEKALGIEITPELRKLRRLFYCGEWIASHAIHIFLLHLADFLGYESAISMASDHRELVQDGLRIKKVANQLLNVVGGRAIHPINAAVGGFHRAPDPVGLRNLLPELEWAQGTMIDTLELLCRLEFPDVDVDYDLVSLHHANEYPMNQGRVATRSGMDIAIEEYEQHFAERQVPHSTALHSVLLPAERPYLVGPLARVNLCFDQLSPMAKSQAERHRDAWSATNNYHSIVVRAIEMIDALEEAIEIIRDYRATPSVFRVPYEPRDGTGCHATEAPRGLLYHRYEIGADGKIKAARIVPPTAQNQGQIEADLRNMISDSLDLDDAALTHRCECLIRNYDPCISCATHFVTLALDRA